MAKRVGSVNLLSNIHDLSDLDIILYNEDDPGYYSSAVDGDEDPDENVQQVSAPSNINAVIKVYAVDESFDGVSSEAYALATQESFVKADPPYFDVGLSMPASVETSTNFTVTVDVTNNGDVKAHNNSVTLSLPGGFSIQSGANPQNIGTIAAGGTGQATWTVRSSATPGGYNLSASNESPCYYETYTGASGNTPITVTAVAGPHALSNDTPETFSETNKIFTFNIMGNDWCGVAINPSPNDYDVKIDNDSDCSSPYADSYLGSTTRDFVVANGHIKGTVIHYAQVYYGTSGSYIIEAEWNAFDITTGNVYSDSMPAGDVIQMYESYLISGNQYQVDVDITSGTGDLALYVFRASREQGSRYSSYDYFSNSGDSGGDESLSFTADCTGEFGIAVINENASSASYNISVTEVDTDAPDPDPMTWLAEPGETGTSSIAMVATAASDESTPIEYYFNFYDSPTGGSGGTDQDWQASTSYTDTGLQANHQYGYRVKAKDSVGNDTGYSSVSYDYTDIETPTDITFGTVTATSIQARSTNTPSGLTRGSSGLIIYNVTKGTNSDWKQNNNLWTSGSLSPNTQYGFRARAKNGDGDPTGYCSTAYKHTLANAPGVAGFTNVTQTSIRANWTANGNPAGTEYWCENTTSGTNSDWTTNTYWDSTGLACGTTYSFRVYSKNGNGVQAGPTSLGSQMTSECETPASEIYCTSFDEQGDWVYDAKIYVDEANSRLYWYTDSSYHSAYDNISEVTKAGDVIEFEYRYIDHYDGSTLQNILFGFTDSMPTENVLPANFIGGLGQNYWYDFQTHILIYKNNTCLFNWGENDHPSGTPAVYKAKIEILDTSTYAVTVWKDGDAVYTRTERSGNLTGMRFPLCAAWNAKTQSLSMGGWYKGYLDYICWTGPGRKGIPPGILNLLLGD